MTRIGTIRKVIEENGGKVIQFFANGPGYSSLGTMGGFSQQGPNAGKVLYKIVTESLSGPELNRTLVQLTMFYGWAGIERAYVCGNGHLKVVFTTTAERAKHVA